MCTWMTAAPAASHSLAVTTSSFRVTGSAGTADLSASAPAGPTVIRVSRPLLFAPALPAPAPRAPVLPAPVLPAMPRTLPWRRLPPGHGQVLPRHGQRSRQLCDHLLPP